MPSVKHKMAEEATIICFIVAILTIPQQSFCSSSTLPHEKCSLKDSACMTTQARILSKYFIRGVPELGIQKMDKILIDFLEIKKNGLIYEMKNVEVEGIDKAVINNVSVDMEYKTMRLSLQTSFIITGDYTAEGVLLKIPVLGDGRVNITINDVKLEMLILFDVIQNKEGKDVINLTEYIFGFDVIGNGHYNYENTYNGDKQKGDKLNSFLNEYWRTMIARFGTYLLKNVTDAIFNATKLYFDLNILENLATY